MATRTVEVLLRLSTDQYKRGAKEAADATDRLDHSVDELDKSVKDVDGDLKKIPADAAKAAASLKTVGRDADSAAKDAEQLGEKLKDVDQELKKLPPDAARAVAAMKLLGGDVGSVGEKVGSLGEKNTGLAVLDAKIREASKEVRKLGDEFVKTADVDVFKKLGEAEGKLRGLQDVRKKLGSALVDGVEDAAKVLPKTLAKGGTQAGSEFSKLFSSGLAGGLSTPVLGPILVAAVAAIAVPLATFVGAAIGGAVLAGGAAAAAGGGLAGAWMGDPVRYQGMWNKAIDGIQRRWMDSSAAFGNELEDSLKIVDRVLRDLPIERILAISQSFVAPLAGGIGAGITAAADGFADALARAQPIIDKVGPAFANLGHDVGDFFRIISMGSEQGGSALSDLIGVVGWVTKAVGIMILGFELAYGAIKDYASAVNDTAHSVPVLGGALDYVNEKLFHIGVTGITAGRALGDLDGASSASATSLGGMASAAAKAAIETLGLNDALTETRSTMLGLADANLGVAQGWLDLRDELNSGAKSLDTTTREGIKNTRAIEDQIGALERQRVQAIATGGNTADAIAKANAAYAEQVEKVRQAAYAAHFNKDEVDKLIASLGAVPGDVKSNVDVSGLATSLAQGVSLGNALNNIDGSTYSAHVNISGMGAALASAARLSATLSRAGQSRGSGYATGGVRRAAVGMIIPPSDPGTTLVGEPQTGGEVLTPLRGITAARAMQLSQVAGNSYGFDVVPRERQGLQGTRDMSGYRSYQPSLALAAAAGGGAAGPAEYHFHNHGVIGSRMETENWLSGAVDNLRRKGRL